MESVHGEETSSLLFPLSSLTLPPSISLSLPLSLVLEPLLIMGGAVPHRGCGETVDACHGRTCWTSSSLRLSSLTSCSRNSGDASPPPVPAPRPAPPPPTPLPLLPLTGTCPAPDIPQSNRNPNPAVAGQAPRPPHRPLPDSGQSEPLTRGGEGKPGGGGIRSFLPCPRPFIHSFVRYRHGQGLWCR